METKTKRDIEIFTFCVFAMAVDRLFLSSFQSILSAHILFYFIFYTRIKFGILKYTRILLTATGRRERERKKQGETAEFYINKQRP